MNGDLISRSALIQHAYSAVVDGVEKDIIDLSDVDNAPTVEPEKTLIANVNFDENKLKEIVQTEVINKIKSGELVLKDERPQGEWELHGMIYYCSNCGHYCGESGDNFCGNCGADMRGAV